MQLKTEPYKVNIFRMFFFFVYRYKTRGFGVKPLEHVKIRTTVLCINLIIYLLNGKINKYYNKAIFLKIYLS